MKNNAPARLATSSLMLGYRRGTYFCSISFNPPTTPQKIKVVIEAKMGVVVPRAAKYFIIRSASIPYWKPWIHQSIRYLFTHRTGRLVILDKPKVVRV